MSGLLALLDDVASIAKVAAASVDDVAGQAAKAGVKAAGAVIDDAAVTPKYVHGFDAAREVPIVWRIAKGSLFNKLVRALIYYIEETEIHNLDAPLRLLKRSQNEAYTQAWARHPHGDHDDTPPEWREYK